MSRDPLQTSLALVGALTVTYGLAALAVKAWHRRAENRRVATLEDALRKAEIDLRQAEARALHTTPAAEASDDDTPRRKIRVYIDGCFDMLHFGHSNALRQARAVGDELVVGLINDEEIMRNKGSAPVIPQDERAESLRANKFVDEVICDAPYDLTKEWVDELVEKHNIDYVVHGDDPCITADGKDAYAYAKSIGRFKMIKRTEGVSTTDIVGRMLLMSRDHHIKPSSPSSQSASSFLPTSRRITQFSSGRAPADGDKVVYIAGSWDLFNIGHMKALEKARTFGDFLLVGIHDDQSVNKLQGGGFPILNLHERTLSVLSCRFVDEVVIGAPLHITADLIRSMNISVVVKGTVTSGAHDIVDEALKVPRDMGILKEFSSPSSMTATDIIDRIMAQREMFSKRYDAKSKSEADYYATKKEYVAEA